MAIPGAGDRARARGIRAEPAADFDGSELDRRGHVRVRARLGPSGNARPLPGDAGRGFHDRGIAGTGGRAAHA